MLIITSILQVLKIYLFYRTDIGSYYYIYIYTYMCVCVFSWSIGLCSHLFAYLLMYSYYFIYAFIPHLPGEGC